jgi:outer membrane lipopolysaccharide assembly protein LptE/RlpB
MRRRDFLVALGAAAAAGAAGGCGYGLRGNLPAHLQTIAIPVFANRTSEPNVENIMTRAVVDAFNQNGRLKVTTLDRADSVLEGEVVGYNVVSIAFDSRANVQQYRLTVTMNLLFRDLRRDEVLFDRRAYSEKADFQVQGTVSATIAREESVVLGPATDIARTIVNLAVERF